MVKTFTAVFHQPGPLREYLLQNIRQGCPPMRVLYEPTTGKIEAHFECVTALVLAYGDKGKGVIYAVDEIDRFCSASYVSPQTDDLINYGRHRKVSGMFTSRRPAQVARELTSQCAEIRVFKTTEPRDLKYFESVMGKNATLLIPKLKKYQYVRWTDDCEEPTVCGGQR